MEFIIQTERLLLRPFLESDAEALHAISNQPHVLRRMPDWESTVEETRGLIRYFEARQRLANKSEAKVLFALEHEGSIIGMIGVGNKEEVNDEIEIAFFIGEAHAGKGYMTEAAKAVSRWVLTNLDLDYLMAIVEPDNIPSRRVVEKCGFHMLDTLTLLNSGETEQKPFFYYRLYKS
ncbi:MAG TPA: GNAT family N-acetyltransferase [Clostridia bacterium]|nr:GNAT family N-acetyltransferase [Clostridia bacterium]